MIVAKHCKFIDSLLRNMDSANVLLLYGFNSVYSSYCSGFFYSVLICLLCAALCLRNKVYKTSSAKFVATSFLYLTVHRQIAGYVPVYLKFAFKVTHPFRKRPYRIDRFCLIAVRASKKVQISLIWSRQCVFHPATDKPCALPLSPPKGGSKQDYFTYFCFAFSHLRCR